MDYNLVLKFKKYPENKPMINDGLINESVPCVVIVENSDNNNSNYLYDAIYFPEIDEFDTEDGEIVVAFAYKPISNNLIELLNSEHETILVTKSYLSMLEDSHEFLSCLREAGVDNWCGYDEAISIRDSFCDED